MVQTPRVDFVDTESRLHQNVDFSCGDFRNADDLNNQVFIFETSSDGYKIWRVKPRISPSPTSIRQVFVKYSFERLVKYL